MLRIWAKPKEPRLCPFRFHTYTARGTMIRPHCDFVRSTKSHAPPLIILHISILRAAVTSHSYHLSLVARSQPGRPRAL